MDQIVYSVLAVLLVVLFALTMQRGRLGTQQRMLVNEVSTQATALADAVLGLAVSLPFDEHSDETKRPRPLSWPVVPDVDALTPASLFGGCTALQVEAPTCDDVDDFHGLTASITSGGVPYEYAVAVRYVEEDDPEEGAASNTFAKEVRVDVWTPHLGVGGGPLVVRARRLATYQRHVQAP